MEAVTLGIALLGAALGVINTWWGLYRDRVRLKVSVVWQTSAAILEGSNRMLGRVSAFPEAMTRVPDGRIGIRVVNLGFVPIQLEAVGFTTSGWFARRRRRALKVRSLVACAFESVELPVRLEPRQAVVLYAEGGREVTDRATKGVTRVYAKTGCGLHVFGTSGLLRALVARAARA